MAGSTVIKPQVHQKIKTRQHAEKSTLDWARTKPQTLVQDAKHKFPWYHERLLKYDSLDYVTFQNVLLLFVFIKLFHYSQNIIRITNKGG
jgi:hypothetical protein